MVPANKPDSLSTKLLEQDGATRNQDYEAYRSRLKRLIESARRRERTAFWVCMVSGIISFSLMFVGGARVAGSFDPWSDDATILSMILGPVFLTSTIIFWVLLASYYSRFRPHTRQAREDLRDLQLLRLESQMEAIQEQLSLLRREQQMPTQQSSESNEPRQS